MALRRRLSNRLGQLGERVALPDVDDGRGFLRLALNAASLLNSGSRTGLLLSKTSCQ